MARYATLETPKDLVRRKNFFNVVFAYSAAWIVFQFVSIWFFGYFLKSAALVGVFLGVGAAVAMAIDVPVGVLQKYFRPRSLVLAATGMMFVVAAIFTYLVMGSPAAGFIRGEVTEAAHLELVKELMGFVFGSPGNALLVFLAALMMGFITEIYDVTTLSYLMDNADPSEYGELISKKNVYTGAGSVVGLALASAILFVKSPGVVILPFVLTIAALVAFVTRYFDNSEAAVDPRDILKLKVVATRGAERVKEFAEDPKAALKEYAVATIEKADFQRAASAVKIVLLKPIQVAKSVDRKEVARVTRREFRGLWDVLGNPKYRNRKILWVSAAILLFGYWDTFAVTYLSDYLSTLDGGVAKYPYVMLAVLAVPIFTLQLSFIKISRKAGYWATMVFGIALSALAAFVLPTQKEAWAFLFFGVVNTTGYAAAMPLAQSVFSEYYNELYAKNYGLKEIDSNTSAAPLKVLQNLANVFGTVLGGLFVTLGFKFAILAYALLLSALLGFGVLRRRQWEL